MSKHSSKPEWHEPVEAVILDAADPMEDTIEVGEVTLIDGPIDPVPFQTSPATDKMTDQRKDKVQDVTQKAQDAAYGIADKAQDVTRKLAEGASQAKDAAGDALDTVKSTAGDALDTVKSAGTNAKVVLGDAAGKVGTAGAAGARTVGSLLWSIAQRNPLQAIVLIASVVWLVRNNKATASQTPVSLPEVGEKVGSVAGQVQVAAVNLSHQLNDQAQRGAGWFAQTLQTNPLALGALAVVAGAAIGLAVPETAQEHKIMGETRDKLAGQVQQTAQDLTQKVTAVAQTAAHEALETAKEEAKNQGLAVQ